MKLHLVRDEKLGRSLYIYLPQGEPRTAFKRSSLTILRDSSDEASVLELLLSEGLAELAEKNQLILSFPNPTDKGWNFELASDGPDDIDAIEKMQERLGSAEYSKGFHPMNDVKYLMGVGKGADMAISYAALRPLFVAAVVASGGKLCARAAEKSLSGPVPAYFAGADENTVKTFVGYNSAELVNSDGDTRVFRNSINPSKCVIATGAMGVRELAFSAWEDLLRHTRRPNTDPLGDPERRLLWDDSGFEFFIDDTRLGDNNGLPHTWFTHVPASVRNNPDKKVPLLIFGHGGSDCPAEAAEMSKFHELGEKEGFITVYPWGSNKMGWNSFLTPDQPSDVDYYLALIKYMVENYPVDSTRIYLSGFSMGASMAHCFAMVHPELIAAICPIDTMWPPVNPDIKQYTPVPASEVAAFNEGRKRKKEYDYRMPVWYTYGGREVEYPVVNISGQQAQYDFWKEFNNITIKPTPGRENPNPSGVGVDGDRITELFPCPTHPHHRYTVHTFFTNDPEPKDYYNYVMMHGKAHDVAAFDPALGWKYVSRFRRNPDGSLTEL